jgi:Zn finger protein HypA/HybF involved in hydrogenase expression
MPRTTTKEQRQIERYDKVFWLCLNCQSRMKRGFMVPEDDDAARVRCPLCHSTNVVEDGRKPGKIR